MTGEGQVRWEGGYFKLLQPWPRQTLGKHARKPVQGLRGVHIPSRCEVTGSGYLPGRGKCVYTWGLSSLCRTFNCSVGTISWDTKGLRGPLSELGEYHHSGSQSERTLKVT